MDEFRRSPSNLARDAPTNMDDPSDAASLMHHVLIVFRVTLMALQIVLPFRLLLTPLRSIVFLVSILVFIQVVDSDALHCTDSGQRTCHGHSEWGADRAAGRLSHLDARHAVEGDDSTMLAHSLHTLCQVTQAIRNKHNGLQPIFTETALRQPTCCQYSTHEQGVRYSSGSIAILRLPFKTSIEA
jgi:hypothetical protein